MIFSLIFLFTLNFSLKKKKIHQITNCIIDKFKRKYRLLKRDNNSKRIYKICYSKFNLSWTKILIQFNQYNLIEIKLI